jgi:hypothetical protein
MNLTKEQIERKIKQLNAWLLVHKNAKDNTKYKQKERDRNYYVNQLIELEEYGYSK